MFYDVVDGDSSAPHNTIEYFIRNPSNSIVHQLFRVTDGGELRLITSVAQRTEPSYQVLIGARDRGNPSRESDNTVTVNINVLSRDNAAPIFTESYSEEVASTAPRGYFIVRVQATDPDPNSVLTYSIIRKYLTI